MAVRFCLVEMFVSHKASLKTETLPGNIQLACSGDVLALSYVRNTVAVWNLGDESEEVFICFSMFMSLWHLS